MYLYFRLSATVAITCRHLFEIHMVMVLQRFPDPVAVFKGPTSKGREEERGGEGKGEGKGKGG